MSETAFIVTRAKFEMENAEKYTQKARTVSSEDYRDRCSRVRPSLILPGHFVDIFINVGTIAM